MKTILNVEGMKCPNCERHMREAIEKAFPGAKATASAADKTCIIESEAALDEAAVRAAVAATRYTLVSIAAE